MDGGVDSRAAVIARVPVEIWETILSHTIHVDRPSGYMSQRGGACTFRPFEPAQIQWDGICSSISMGYKRRKDADEQMHILGRVSSSFSRLMRGSLPMYAAEFEWIVVETERQAVELMDLLEETISGRKKGHWVRRLEFTNSRGVAPFTLRKILSSCSGLEELIYEKEVDSTMLVSMLGQTCPSSLRCLVVDGLFGLKANDIFHLLNTCPKVETLAFALIGSRGSFLPVPDFPVIGPLALRIISFGLSDECHPLLFWLAMLDLPHFYALKICRDFRLQTPPTFPDSLTAFLKSHGNKITQFEVLENYDPLSNVQGIGWDIVDRCPNLRDLTFALSSTSHTIANNPRPHRKIRRIGCYSFYLEHNHGEDAARRLSTHLDNVFDTIMHFIGGDLPELQLIRFFDVQPSLMGSVDNLPEGYKRTIEMIRSMCGANQVRFEDALGDLVSDQFTRRSLTDGTRGLS